MYAAPCRQCGVYPVKPAFNWFASHAASSHDHSTPDVDVKLQVDNGASADSHVLAHDTCGPCVAPSELVVGSGSRAHRGAHPQGAAGVERASCGNAHAAKEESKPAMLNRTTLLEAPSKESFSPNRRQLQCLAALLDGRVPLPERARLPSLPGWVVPHTHMTLTAAALHRATYGSDSEWLTPAGAAVLDRAARLNEAPELDK